MPYSLFYLLLLLASFLVIQSGNAEPFPPEIAAWSDAKKDAQLEAGKKLLVDIEAAVRRGDHYIRVAKGDYRFDTLSEHKYPSHITWTGLKDVTIDFQGSTFWFTEPKTGLKLVNCENLKLENLFMDWDPLPNMQGKIVALHPEESAFDVKLDPGYEEAVTGRMRNSDGTSKWRGFLFDKENGDFKAGQSGFSLSFKWDQKNEDGSYRNRFWGFYGTSLEESGLEVGDPIVILSRAGRAIRIENLVNCVFEDITLYSSPFVAFASWGGSGHVFRRCKILRRPNTDRLIAGNADGINCANMEQGPLIEDCEIWNLGDDFVNIHASLARAIAQPAPNQIVTSILNNRPTIEREIILEFYERSTMQSLGVRRAIKVEYLPEWYIDAENCTADLKHRWHSGDAAGLAYGATVKAHKITLDSPFEVNGDVIVVCPEFSSPGAVIRGNVFRGSPAKGIRQQAPKVLIENNDISYTGGAGLSLFGHPSYWGEGPYVFDAVVQNNRFFRNVWFQNASSSAALLVREADYRNSRLNRNIEIRENRIIESGGSGIVANGVTGLVVVDNVIDGYGFARDLPNRSSLVGHNYGLVLDASMDVLMDANVIEHPGSFAAGECYIEESEFQ
jgi:hypothetical protein